MKKPLLEAWCIFATKLKIYDERIELGNFFGLSETVIPRKKVNIVKKQAISNKITITTIGGEDIVFITWNIRLGKKIYDYLKTW